MEFESKYGLAKNAAPHSMKQGDRHIALIVLELPTTPRNSMLVPVPAMKGQRAVIRKCTTTKGGNTFRFLAQPTAIQIVVNVEENVNIMRDKETVRTKEIILFEYVS